MHVVHDRVPIAFEDQLPIPKALLGSQFIVNTPSPTLASTLLSIGRLLYIIMVYMSTS